MEENVNSWLCLNAFQWEEKKKKKEDKLKQYKSVKDILCIHALIDLY